MPELVTSPPLLALVALLAYLLGSVPFGVVITRLMGFGDLRQIGSGNIGATNVLRTGSKPAALATLVLDAGKGGAAVLVARALLGEDAAQLAPCRIPRPSLPGLAEVSRRQGRGYVFRHIAGAELAGRPCGGRVLAGRRDDLAYIVAGGTGRGGKLDRLDDVFWPGRNDTAGHRFHLAGLLAAPGQYQPSAGRD